jgi:hypothetical protein
MFLIMFPSLARHMPGREIPVRGTSLRGMLFS